MFETHLPYSSGLVVVIVADYSNQIQHLDLGVADCQSNTEQREAEQGKKKEKKKKSKKRTRRTREKRQMKK